MALWQRTLTCGLLLLALTGGSAVAQIDPQFGVGVQMMGSTTLESAGPGLQVRTSIPLTYDLSVAFGGAFTGYPFAGGNRTVYAFDPEANFVITLIGPPETAPYLLSGGGYHLPIGSVEGRYEEVNSGPTFHFGIGKVWVSKSVSYFVEATPTLFFRRHRTDVLMPLRVGIIF